MNYAVGEGNPDDRVREQIRTLRKKAKKCRERAKEAAKCGKLDTARNALALADEYLGARIVK